MSPRWLSVLTVFFFTNIVSAIVPSINTTITFTSEDFGKCRLCPLQLCSSRYLATPNITATCWTRGDNQGGEDGDNIWLYSTKDCYISSYWVEYNGTAGEDLRYCGRESEEKTYERHTVDTKYDADCNKEPSHPRPLGITQAVSLYNPGSSLDVVCYRGERKKPLYASERWLITVDGCWMMENLLQQNDDLDDIPPCELPENDDRPTATKSKQKSNIQSSLTIQTSPTPKLLTRWLFNDTVGNDFAHCYSQPRNTSSRIKSYEYDDYSVTIQCLTPDYEAADPWAVAWGLTTDWCYVDERDFWTEFQNELTVYEPLCEKFGQITKPGASPTPTPTLDSNVEGQVGIDSSGRWHRKGSS